MGDLHVFIEPVFAGETSTAQVTEMFILSRMVYNVTVQSNLAGKCFTAVITGKSRPVNLK